MSLLLLTDAMLDDDAARLAAFHRRHTVDGVTDWPTVVRELYRQRDCLVGRLLASISHADHVGDVGREMRRALELLEVTAPVEVEDFEDFAKWVNAMPRSE